MATRRDFLVTGAMLAVARTSAWGLDVGSASVRYRTWLSQFQRDIAGLSAEKVSREASVSEERVGILCERSIVPYSRAAMMVSEWMMDITAKRNARRGIERYASLSSIAMLLFENSVPAGYGGLFPEAPGSHFPSDRFSVWYMHIGGSEVLQAYFDDKAQFPNYQLPPEGMLKRHAYPFLLFEDAGYTLRLAGIGAEWMGAAVYLHRKQYA